MPEANLDEPTQLGRGHHRGVARCCEAQKGTSVTASYAFVFALQAKKASRPSLVSVSALKLVGQRLVREWTS